MAEEPSTQSAAIPFRNGGNGGTVLSSYLDAELNAEQARRESLERRGLALITVAGGGACFSPLLSASRWRLVRLPC
jgi:hypothetical protein